MPPPLLHWAPLSERAFEVNFIVASGLNQLPGEVSSGEHTCLFSERTVFFLGAHDKRRKYCGSGALYALDCCLKCLVVVRSVARGAHDTVQ